MLTAAFSDCAKKNLISIPSLILQPHQLAFSLAVANFAAKIIILFLSCLHFEVVRKLNASAYSWALPAISLFSVHRHPLLI